MELSIEDLQRFCDFLYSRTGIQMGETKRYFIERRLTERGLRTGALGFADYFQRLRMDPTEISALISAFTINETYFYREEHQFRCLTNDILPEIIRSKAPGDRIRLWSQPCSTGEEPYSIALWLLENWRLVDAYHIEIVGSDLDGIALDTARIGHYAARALNKLPPKIVEDYFVPLQGGIEEEWALLPDLLESVIFTSANLIDLPSMQANGQFDVIFCRNVLIYFDETSRKRAADNLWTCLRPGGFICLGHTESMSRMSDRFELRRFNDAIVYQRPLER